MNIWHISDLHFNDEQIAEAFTYGDIPKADVAVVVGDVSDKMNDSLDWCANVIRPHMPVVYVPGNHDFYYADLMETSAKARKQAAKLGLYYLDGDTVHINGVRFVGATFWSDLELGAVENGQLCPQKLEENLVRAKNGSDFKKIYADRRNSRFVTPEMTRSLHLEQKGYIKRALSRRHDGPTVVATHFAIHELSSNPIYRHTPTAHCYLSDQDKIIAECSPTAWLHGHVHDCYEYDIHGTRVACNPGGYPHESGNGFRWNLVHSV
jgi:Icc-related predicted phosphoesterase